MCSIRAYVQLVRAPGGARRGLALAGRRPAEARPAARSGRPARHLPRRHGGAACWTLETRPDGHSDLVLYGEFRFELEREIADTDAPYRLALVRLVEEPWFNERDAGVVRRAPGHRRAAALVSAKSWARSFPLDVDDLASGDCPFEELVNRVACRVDLPPVRKLQLLTESLLERGLSVLSILRSRQQVLDMLRPYRRLADGSERN